MPPRTLVVESLHLALLWAFAVAQPLFDLLGHNAAFFAVRGSRRGDIVVFALAAVFAVPLALLVIEAIAALIDARLRWALHLLFFAGLAALLALYILKKATGGGSHALIPAAIVLGIAAAALYAWRSEVRWGLTIVSPALAVILAAFLLFSPVHELVIGSTAKAQLAGAAPRAPVVMVIFDEFPVTSLLSAPDRIDARRFPNFAALARGSTWYANTSATAENTEAAVPAIMTGDWPQPGALPTLSDHPQNIFTLFGGRGHHLNVHEAITHLCPEAVCAQKEPGFASRMHSLASDLSVVSLHLLLPKDLEARLPSISSSWQNFRGGPKGGNTTSVLAAFQKAEQQDQSAGLRRWADRVRTRGSSVNVSHVLLPHVPWQFLPDGSEYGSPDVLPGLSQEYWYGGRWQVLQGYQRHLLQVGYVDRVLGEIVRRLKAKGVYDRALFVVTADHGVSFHQRNSRRVVNPANIGDIAPVPLFIKAPHQRRGRIVRTHLQTIDILPTITDMLGVRIPWHVDGHSALKPGADRSVAMVHKTLHKSEPGFKGGYVTVPWSRLEQLRLAALRRQLALFGSGGWEQVYALGPASSLVGRRVPGRVPAARGMSATIDEAPLLAHVQPSVGFLPAHLTGSVNGATGATPLVLAFAVNGRVVASTTTYRFLGHTQYSAIVPPSALRAGANSVRVLAVTPAGLAELGSTGGAAAGYTLSGGQIAGPGGRRIRIVPGAVRGNVDSSRLLGNAGNFSGWAVDTHLRRAADQVLLFAGGRFVTAVNPGVDRPDVAKAIHIPDTHTGWSMQVPAAEVAPGGHKATLQFFAVAGGVASALPFGCTPQRHDFGCTG